MTYVGNCSVNNLLAWYLLYVFNFGLGIRSLNYYVHGKIGTPCRRSKREREARHKTRDVVDRSMCSDTAVKGWKWIHKT